MPCSASVGTFGSISERVLVEMPSGLRLPARMCGSACAVPRKATWICPPRRSVTSCALPLYGTCLSLTFASEQSSSKHLIESGGMVPMQTDDGGTTQVVLLPLLMGERRMGVRQPLPKPGEHTDEILGRLRAR